MKCSYVLLVIHYYILHIHFLKEKKQENVTQKFHKILIVKNDAKENGNRLLGANKKIRYRLLLITSEFKK